VRVIWGGLQLGVAAVLLLGGGLEALQTLSIVAGFPFMVLMIFMAVGLFRGLSREIEELELHELAFKRRLEELLAETESAKIVDQRGTPREERPPPPDASP